ncbi:MAG: serine/threonine-protein kinase [Planctomycetota bacterium]
MDKTPDERTTPGRDRELIAAAGIEAAELTAEQGGALPPADAVPGYRITREIGRGGMGVVYEALQEGTNRIVALKLILAGPFAAPSTRRRFDREVKLAARLSHPSIVRVLDSGQLPAGQRYYAMEFVDGVSLDGYLALHEPDARTILLLFAEICDGIEHAQACGVVHRDLKPANVLVGDNGKPRILDFGLGKAMDHSDVTSLLATSVSAPGQILGTLRYMSPEQTAGMSQDVDARTDVYALGVMLFEAMTKSMPYDTRGHPSAVLQRIMEEMPTRPTTLSSRVDAEIETILLKALEKDRARRYQTAGEMRDDIRRYLTNVPILAKAPSSLYLFGRKLSRHRRRIALAAVVVVLSIGAAWGGIWWENRGLARQEAIKLTSLRAQMPGILMDIAEGRTERSKLLLEDVVGRGFPLPEARLMLARIDFQAARQAQRRDQIADSMSRLRRARADGPSAWVFDVLLARMCRQNGDAKQTEQLNARVEREAPETTEAWYLRSYATLETDETARCAERAVDLDPQHELAWRQLVHSYMLLRRFDDACTAADHLIDLGDDRFGGRMLQGHALMLAQRYELAVAPMTEAIGLAPDSDSAYRERGGAYLCLGRYAEAVEDYTKAAELGGPERGWELYKRATPLWMMGKADEAAADYREVIKRLGKAPFASIRLCIVLRHQARELRGQGRLEEAQHKLDEADSVLGSLDEKGVEGGDSREGGNGSEGGGGIVRHTAWPAPIVDCLLGRISPQALLDTAKSQSPGGPGPLCEALYYAGEVCLLNDDPASAQSFFKACVDTGVVFNPGSFPPVPMNEYHLAQWRLSGGDAGGASDASSTESNTGSTASPASVGWHAQPEG